MNYKEFPSVFWKQLDETLRELKKTSANSNLIAAFDADGTLWDTDLGENFFHFQIEKQLVNLPKDPWNYYLQLKKKNDDPRDAYVWLAQINKGQTISQVKQWAQQAFDQLLPAPVFSEQKKLIQVLKQNQVKVFVVTASVKWAVEPGARALGLSEDDVIGVETLIDGNSNLVTDIGKNPITYRSGKVEALLQRTQGAPPFLCAGNSIGDLELLESATHIRLAVSASSRDDGLFKSENELLRRAEQAGWFGHRFI